MDMTKKVQSRLTAESGASASPFSTLMQAWLDQNLSIALKMGKSMAVMVVRIDEYHQLMRACGDDGQDAFVATLSSRMKRVLRQAGASIRSADDCFTVICPFDGDLFMLYGTAKTMLQDLQQPVRLGGHDRRVTASIGIAIYPEDGNSADLLLKRVHEALDRTDRYGGNGFCFYSRSAAKHVADELSMHEDLRRSLDTDNLAMRFQPILDLSRNCMSSVAGETHWQHPEHDPGGKRCITSLAERAGLKTRLNERIVDEVCRKLIDWHGAGIDRSVSITLSRSQIIDGHLARLLAQRLSAPGILPDSLEVCIDQKALLAETDHRFRTGLQNLVDLGISLNVTEIGRGALAFQSLQSLPVRSVCLAPSMIGTVGRCSAAEAMLEAVIGFMHGLGLNVRAVDVRYQEQLDFLKDHGCDEASGPYFAPALKGADIDRLTDFSPCIGRRQNLMLMPQHMSMH